MYRQTIMVQVEDTTQAQQVRDAQFLVLTIVLMVLLVAAVSHPYDQSAQWQTTQNVQGYPQQWSQAAGPSPSPPTPFTSPPTQYNPSMYGPMPGGQPRPYLPPLPTYVSVSS